MANNVVTLDVDWASKSGMANATIGFGETFDLEINGVETLFSTLRLVLLSQSVSDETAILWTYLPETYEWTEDWVTIRNVRIYDKRVLDMLKSQGGKAKLYLSVASQTEDGHFVDYGVSKVTLTIGSYLEDSEIPPNTEISGITIGELKAYTEEMLATLRRLEVDVAEAVEEAEGYAEEAKGVRAVAVKASQDAADAVETAGDAKMKAEVAEQVAKGAQYAKVFATEAEMKAWAAAEMAKAEDQREVKVGDNLYITDTGVPDYWWTGEGDGYSQLETGAVKIEVDKALSETSANPVQNKAVKAALDEKADVSSVTGLESALEGKQDRLVVAATSHNLGAANPDSLADTSTLGDYNSIDLQVGTLAQWGILGPSARPTKITLFRRSGSTENGGTNMWLRILRWNGSAWFVAYQSSTYVTHNSYTGNGQRIEHTMVHKGGSEFIPTDERVVICYVQSETSDAASLIGFGAKIVASPSGIGMIANARDSVPSDGAFTVSQPYRLAADFEYDVAQDLGEVLEGKADKQHTHSINSVDGLSLALSDKLNKTLSVGETLSFGEMRLCYIEKKDLRFGLAGGTFCIEAGSLKMGSGASFAAGDFYASAYELGEILKNVNGGSDGGTPYLAIGDGCTAPAVAGNSSIALGRGAGSGSPDAANLCNTIAIGERADPHYDYSIVIGNNSCSSKEYQILIGYYIDSASDHVRFYVDNNGLPDAIMFQACHTGVFFSNDACTYATMIGYKTSCGCYEVRRIEEAFTSSGSGGDAYSYIMASEAASAYEVPGCSSGIAIGPRACIGANVVYGVAIGVGVMATSATPVQIGAGCSAITVNNNYELCVGGNPVGGGASNPLISMDNPNNNAYCSHGGGSSYIAIGIEARAYGSTAIAIGAGATAGEYECYSDYSVAIGADAYANEGEVAIGYVAGKINRQFISSNDLNDVRFFRACSNGSAGNELFFASKDGKAVLGGEFFTGYVDQTVTRSLCYFYLQDVADMLANGGGTVDAAFSATSEKPVQNKVIKAALDGKASAQFFNSSDSNFPYIENWAMNENKLRMTLVGGNWNGTEGSNDFDDAILRFQWFYQYDTTQAPPLETLDVPMSALKTLVNESGGSSESLNVLKDQVHGLVVNSTRPDSPSEKPYYFLAGKGLDEADPFSAFFVNDVGDVGVFIDHAKYVFTPEMFSVAALEARVAALETQLASVTATLESNSCVSGAGTIANEGGTEVNYLQNPTGLLDGDELL